jgi:type I restriction enzyme S subunit
MTLQVRKLAEVCQVFSGGTPSRTKLEYFGGGIPWVKITDMLQGTIVSTEETLTAAGIENSSARLLPSGTVLISIFATIGRTAVLGIDAATNQAIAGVVPQNKAQLDSQYLRYFLDSQHSELNRVARGVAQPNINQGILKDLNVPLPPLTEQRRIVDILSRADGIVRLRRDAERKAVELIPALFLDMFGDSATNPKGWTKAKLGDLIHAAQDGPHVSPTYSSDGIPFLSTRHIKPGKVVFDDLKFISIDEAERQWKKCKPVRGDVFYTKGGTTGVAAEVDFDQDVAVWVHVALLKTNHALVEPMWLECMLNSAYCYRQSQELTHGIANRDLGLKRMVNIDMYLPPRELQIDFVLRAREVKSITTLQSVASATAQATFDALLSKVFARQS